MADDVVGGHVCGKEEQAGDGGEESSEVHGRGWLFGGGEWSLTIGEACRIFAIRSNRDDAGI